VEIISFKPKYLDQTIDLFNTVFNWGDSNLFKWKFLDPARPGYDFNLGIRDGRVECVYGGFYQHIVQNGVKDLAICVGDSASRPETRESRLFLKASKTFVKGCLEKKNALLVTDFLALGLPNLA